jgi:hypothetical protein
MALLSFHRGRDGMRRRCGLVLRSGERGAAGYVAAVLLLCLGAFGSQAFCLAFSRLGFFRLGALSVRASRRSGLGLCNTLEWLAA